MLYIKTRLIIVLFTVVTFHSGLYSMEASNYRLIGSPGFIPVTDLEAQIQSKISSGYIKAFLILTRRSLPFHSFQEIVQARIKEGKKKVLLKFIRENNIDAIALYLKEDPLFNYRKYCGIIPIFYAMAYGSEDVVRFLVSKGALINARYCYNYITPLHSACYEGRDNLALFLLEHGADVRCKSLFGETPLHFIPIPVRSTTKRLIQQLIRSGVDIDAQIKHRKTTSLHYAIKHADIDFITILLSSGANPNKQDKKGRIPLHSAAKQNNPAASLLLTYFGARSTIRDNNRKTPRDYAQGECKKIMNNTDKYIQQNPEKFEALAKKIREPFQTNQNMVHRLRNRQLGGRF